MLKRAAWVIIGTLILVGIAMLASGCSTLRVEVIPPAGAGIPMGGAAYRLTITSAPARLASLSVDGKSIAACTDALMAPCYQQVGAVVRVNGLAQGREREEGSVNVTMRDAGGRVTETVVKISGWGRLRPR